MMLARENPCQQEHILGGGPHFVSRPAWLSWGYTASLLLHHMRAMDWTTQLLLKALEYGTGAGLMTNSKQSSSTTRSAEDTQVPGPTREGEALVNKGESEISGTSMETSEAHTKTQSSTDILLRSIGPSDPRQASANLSMAGETLELAERHAAAATARRMVQEALVVEQKPIARVVQEKHEDNGRMVSEDPNTSWEKLHHDGVRGARNEDARKRLEHEERQKELERISNIAVYTEEA